MPNTQTINKDGLSEDVLAYIEGLEGENVTLAEALDEATDELLKAASGKTDDTAGETDDEVIKGLAPEVAELVKGLIDPIRQENEALKKSIDGERDIRLTTEQIEKAATLGFGDSTELGMVLKSVMQNCGTDVYDTLVKSLSAASEQVKQAGLFRESGSTASGTPDGTAAALNAAVDGLVSKGDGMTRSEAMRQLARTSPELFRSEGA